MSDSDSELSSAPAIASDASLEKGLRNTVAKLFKSGNREDLTLKRMRLATEKALDLPEGFFKGNAKWKAESDTIIKDEAEKQEAKLEIPEKDPETPVKPKPKPKSKPEKQPARPPKRASPDETAKPTKRQKVSDESGDELSAPPSDMSDEKPKKAVKSDGKQSKGRAKGPLKSKKGSNVVDFEGEEKPSAKLGKGRAMATSKPKKDSKPVDSDEEEPPESKDSKKAGKPGDRDLTNEPTEEANGAAKEADSESELSEVLDPTPKPKRQRQKSSEISKPEKKTRKPSKPKEDPNITPDEAEIKKLQGWLIKCGIRKMWFRELAPYDSSKEKIRHLKGMLKDAGMDGRYSTEKATQIKEERELKADLDMVQEGAKRWGAEDDDDDNSEEADGRGKPKRRLARGLRDVADILGSDDGEETS